MAHNNALHEQVYANAVAKLGSKAWEEFYERNLKIETLEKRSDVMGKWISGLEYYAQSVYDQAVERVNWDDQEMAAQQEKCDQHVAPAARPLRQAGLGNSRLRFGQAARGGSTRAHPVAGGWHTCHRALGAAHGGADLRPHLPTQGRLPSGAERRSEGHGLEHRAKPQVR